jgi:Flp pilus assembly protein TadG
MKILRCSCRKKQLNEQGQAMVLIALAFIGLVAFIGLAIDAGILFAHLGHLRRAVDAAALSAANQIRQSTTIEDITGSAEQLILLNLPAGSAVDDLDVIVETCDTPGTSIPNCTVGVTKRKLARVEATLDVSLAFMPIVGFGTVPLTAEAISEAASIDLVLVIDNSTSMAYDAACNDGDDDDGDGKAENDCLYPDQYKWPGNEMLATNPVPCTGQVNPDDPCMDGGVEFDLPDDYFSYPSICNFFGNCEPFEQVRTAAKTLVNEMYQNYDQIALVTFNKYAGQVIGELGKNTEEPLHEPDLNLTINKTSAINAIDDMRVYPNIEAGQVCSDWAGGGDPRGCMRTNHAAGMMIASRVLDTAINPSARDESVKVVVLLSDGLTNAAYDMGSYPWPAPGGPVQADGWLCHHDWWRDPADGTRVADDFMAPFCTDGNPESGYDGVSNLSINEDPDNLARRYADYLACLPVEEAGGNVCAAGGGIGAVIFTIGLGDGVTNYTYEGGTVPSGVVGEDLLRYIANVGYNGSPKDDPSSNPCLFAPTGSNCGNYYYAPNPSKLQEIFSDIADRIFTRLTH